jgi:hypothetical protein
MIERILAKVLDEEGFFIGAFRQAVDQRNRAVNHLLPNRERHRQDQVADRRYSAPLRFKRYLKAAQSPRSTYGLE